MNKNLVVLVSLAVLPGMAWSARSDAGRRMAPGQGKARSKSRQFLSQEERRALDSTILRTHRPCTKS
jgi:hypothetical protein